MLEGQNQTESRFVSLLIPNVPFRNPLEHLKSSDWYMIYLEDTDLYLADKDTLRAALEQCPDDAAYAYTFAVIEMRERIAVLSGIPF